MTDDYFGFLDDNDGTSLATNLLDIGIGRFPVRTVDEAIIAVDKTIDYINNKIQVLGNVQHVLWLMMLPEMIIMDL